MPARGRGKQRRAGCSPRGRGRCLVHSVPWTGIIAGRSLQSDAHGLWGGLLILWAYVGMQGNRQNLFGEQLAHPYACARARKATTGRLCSPRGRGRCLVHPVPSTGIVARRSLQSGAHGLWSGLLILWAQVEVAGESTKPLRRASCAPLCLHEGEESSDEQVARTEAGDDVPSNPVPSTGIIARGSLQSDAHGLWSGLLILCAYVGMQGNRQNLSGEHLAHPYACARARKATTGRVARTEAGDDVSFIQSLRQASSQGGHCKATRMVCAMRSCSSGRK